jgi:glycosyltransferase involved in cell wall biosynthesis
VKAFWTYSPVLARLEAAGVPHTRVKLFGDLNPAGFSALFRVLYTERPDVVVLTKQREYWMGSVAARIAGRSAVVLRHGTRRALRNDLKRRLSFGALSDLVLVNSSAVKEMLLESPWLEPEKVKVLHNGVTTEPVEAGLGRRILIDLGIPVGAPVVCGVGRLTWLKGFDVLVRAFALVAGRLPGARLLVLGEGGRRRELEDEALRSGVSGATHFVGHRDEVREILSDVDAYVLSSRSEGMANTLLEAMSVGAPIVATDVSGTSEAVRDGIDALVVPPEDPAALAEAIHRLLSDRGLADRLGASALERARREFGMSRMAEALESLLLEALALRTAGA